MVPNSSAENEKGDTKTSGKVSPHRLLKQVLS
jgi:hypothetical protein